MRIEVRRAAVKAIDGFMRDVLDLIEDISEVDYTFHTFLGKCKLDVIRDYASALGISKRFETVSDYLQHIAEHYIWHMRANNALYFNLNEIK